MHALVRCEVCVCWMAAEVSLRVIKLEGYHRVTNASAHVTAGQPRVCRTSKEDQDKTWSHASLAWLWRHSCVCMQQTGVAWSSQCQACARTHILPIKDRRKKYGRQPSLSCVWVWVSFWWMKWRRCYVCSCLSEPQFGRDRCTHDKPSCVHVCTCVSVICRNWESYRFTFRQF